MGAGMVRAPNEVLSSSPALPVFLELAAVGVRFRLDGDQVLVSPRGALTREQREVFRQHQEAVRALVAMVTDAQMQARVAEFTRQLNAAPAPRVPAFLFRAEVPYTPGVCFSCGDDLPSP